MTGSLPLVADSRGRDDRRRGAPRPDASFGELPPPLEVTSLFDVEPDDDRVRVHPAISEALAPEVFAPLPRAGDQRRSAWDGVERRASRPADEASARTAPLPRVTAPRQLPPPKSAPTNPSPGSPRPARSSGPVWPTVLKQRAPRSGKSRRLRVTPSRVRRTVRTVRRVSSLAAMLPLLGWLVIPLLLLVVLLIGLRGGSDDTDPAATTVTTHAVATSAPARTGATSAPTAGASASSTSPGSVHVQVRLDDAAGVARSVQAVILLGDRTLAPTTARLPLTVDATGSADARLTVLVPQPPAGARLTCTVAASGAVTGAMTRAQSEGMLDCSTVLTDLAG